MARKSGAALVLRKIDGMERELAELRREIIHGLTVKDYPKKTKPSLFGAVKAGDVTEEMIEESQRNLFRSMKDL